MCLAACTGGRRLFWTDELPWWNELEPVWNLKPQISDLSRDLDQTSDFSW